MIDNKIQQARYEENQQKVDSGKTHSHESADEQECQEKISNRGAPEFDDPGSDDAQDRGLKHIQRVRDLRELTIFHIKPAQNDHHRRAGQNKSETCKNAAPNFPLQIADVDR